MQEKNPLKLDYSKELLGKRLRKFRTQQGLTQAEFCKKNMLKTAANLSAIEKGRSFPTLDTIASICKNSRVSADSLLFGSAIKDLKDDTDKIEKVKVTVTHIADEYKRLLRSEEMRLQQEITTAIQKRSHLQDSWDAAKMGYLKLELAQEASLSSDLRFVKSYIESLQEEFGRVKEDTIALEVNRQELLDLLK